MISKDGGGGQYLDFVGDTAVKRGNIELMGSTPVPHPTQGKPWTFTPFIHFLSDLQLENVDVGQPTIHHCSQKLKLISKGNKKL